MSTVPKDLPIALTPGDPLGVGPEVGVVAASGRPDLVLLGDRELWARAAELRGVSLEGLRFEDTDPAADPEHAGIPEIAAVATAVKGCLEGRFAAMCTGPIHKARSRERGFGFGGHTPYLAHLCGRAPEEAVMLFAGGRLQVALTTVHIPLSQVPVQLSTEGIVRTARAAVSSLLRLGLPRPRLAICGLNPHAGERGLLGTEDEDLVRPAVERLKADGIDATGPWPADSIFARAARGEFDLVVAQYHDQGLVAVKTLDPGRSVNITAGLPLVRTSVDHGTADDIAWTGRADAQPMVAALDMARRLASGPGGR